MDQKGRIRDLSEKLKSNNPSLVAESILLLRDEPPFRGAVKLLAELLDKTENEHIKTLIISFFNDLKDKDCRSEVVEEIAKPYSGDTVSSLVSSCWQSGQDYSGFASSFADLFTTGNYQVALECFTVLEECAPNVTDEEKTKVLLLLHSAEKKINNDRMPLHRELLKMFA